jgi:hypothetical protein
MQRKVALAYVCHRSQPTMAGGWKVVWRTLNTKPRVAKGAREVANPSAPERRPTDLNWRGWGNLWRARYLPDSEKSADVRSVLLFVLPRRHFIMLFASRGEKHAG